MIDKYLIVIDERDQKAEIKTISNGLKIAGFILHSKQINVSNHIQA